MCGSSAIVALLHFLSSLLSTPIGEALLAVIMAFLALEAGIGPCPPHGGLLVVHLATGTVRLCDRRNVVLDVKIWDCSSTSGSPNVLAFLRSL